MTRAKNKTNVAGTNWRHLGDEYMLPEHYTLPEDCPLPDEGAEVLGYNAAWQTPTNPDGICICYWTQQSISGTGEQIQWSIAVYCPDHAEYHTADSINLSDCQYLRKMEHFGYHLPPTHWRPKPQAPRWAIPGPAQWRDQSAPQPADTPQRASKPTPHHERPSPSPD